MEKNKNRNDSDHADAPLDSFELRNPDKPKRNYADIVRLIRSIQRREELTPCFGTDRRIECGEIDCQWRDYCLMINDTYTSAAPDLETD